jgi:DNA-binding NarL/FixJ family response regulator
MNRYLTIVIAFSSPILAQALSLLLQQQPQIQVSGIVQTPAELQEHLRQYLPRLVLTDTQLGHLDCAALTYELKAVHPEIGIVLFGAPEPTQHIFSAIVAGAEGFVPLHAPFAELLRAIRFADRGQPYTSPDLSKALSHALFRMRAKDAARISPFRLLTEKEQQVLAFICREHTTKEICLAMQLKPSTVDTHRKQLLKKTGARNVAGLVLYAVKEGLIPKYHRTL